MARHIRNLRLSPVAIPLPGGVTRIVLPSDATTVTDDLVRESPAVEAAIACAAVAFVALDPREASGRTIRALVSASARQALASVISTERALAEARARHDAIEAALWQEAVLREAAARAVEAERWIARHKDAMAAKQADERNLRAAVFRGLMHRLDEAGVDAQRLVRLVDGEEAPPPALRHLFGGIPRKDLRHRSTAEQEGSGQVRYSVAYNRRASVALQLARAEARATGDDLERAIDRLAEALVEALGPDEEAVLRRRAASFGRAVARRSLVELTAALEQRGVAIRDVWPMLDGEVPLPAGLRAPDWDLRERTKAERKGSREVVKAAYYRRRARVVHALSILNPSVDLAVVFAAAALLPLPEAA